MQRTRRLERVPTIARPSPAAEFPRARLLQRLADTRPRLAVLVAPAGFGKTTLARQLADLYPTRATCDCDGITSERELCRRLIAALCAAWPEDRLRLTELQFAIGGSPRVDAEILLDLWSQHGDASAFVFENTEALSRHPSLRTLLGRLLAHAPARRTIVVCSRLPVRIPASRSLPPHEIVTLRAADLAFDRSEIEATFAEFDLSAATFDQIEAVTRGWPMALLVLKRFAREGRLTEAVSRLDDVAFEEMYDYLSGEVFETLTARELDALIACAAIGDASDDDVAAALGSGDAEEAAEVVDGLLRAAPMLARSPRGTYDVHPLLEQTIRTRYRRQRRTLLLAAATWWSAHGRPVRAAKLYQRLGDADATARALCEENVAADRVPTLEYTSIVTSLDDETMARYPLLRGFTTFFRRFRMDPFALCDDTGNVWDKLEPTANFELRCNVGCPLARLLYEVGRFDEAEAILRALVPDVEPLRERPRTSGEAYVLRTLGCIAARRGRLAEAERHFQLGYVGIPGASLVMARLAIERAVIERVRGSRAKERELLSEAVALARDSPMRILLACALAESAFGAWLAGDDAEVAGLIDELDGCVTVDALRGFAMFCESARSGAVAHPSGIEQPNWLACGYLMACGTARDGGARREAARAADEAAVQSGDPFLRTLASVALACCSAADRERSLASAARNAAEIESAPLHAAVDALLTGDGDAGMLEPFVRRLRRADGRTADDEPSGERLFVHFVSRAVRRGAEAVRLGNRELALVFALARQRRSYTREELLALLWPDSDEARAREALNSCLYRLRGRFGDDIIAYTGSAYRLRDDVDVDLRRIEGLLSSIGPERALTTTERATFERLLPSLCAHAALAAPSWEWWAPIETRIDDVIGQIVERLARDALRRGDFEAVLPLAALMMERDSCDEAARELLIRAHLGRADRSAALREYRRYCRSLRSELDIEPSAHLAQLLGAGTTPGTEPADSR